MLRHRGFYRSGHVQLWLFSPEDLQTEKAPVGIPVMSSVCFEIRWTSEEVITIEEGKSQPGRYTCFFLGLVCLGTIHKHFSKDRNS